MVQTVFFSARFTSPSSSLLSSRSRVVAGAAGAACILSLSRWFEVNGVLRNLRSVGERHTLRLDWRPDLSPFAIDAICGAMGEIVQISLLYPLDTIKVQCQAEGVAAPVILRRLWAQGLKFTTLQTLYTGCGSASVCSAVIGAAYLVSFCSSKRLATRVADHMETLHLQQQSVVPSPMGVLSASQLVLRPKDVGLGSASHSADNAPPVSEASSSNRAAVIATAAALVSSIVTSVLESPIELFRHRLQAGALQGSLLETMKTACRGGGLSSLYWGYTGFIIKAIPYDVSELFTYSMLNDARSSHPLLQTWSPELTHMSIGALAGVAAVVCSMPADCIKTRLELSPVAPPKGVVRNAVHFFRTGKEMVVQKGFGALFVGMTPRLAEKVPSTMLYWMAVEGCRRVLETHCTRGAQLTLQDVK